MTSTAIETVVRERLGLDPASLGPHTLDRAVGERMRVRGMADPSLYASRLMTEPAERDALAAALAVSETWFFRGGRPLFDRLAAFVADQSTGRSAGSPVRVLSVPCSSGEEPYSLALALHERFLSPDDFTITAVDLSERVLAKAKAARYGPFAFREADLGFRPTYFRQSADSWELLPAIRASIIFSAGNLTEPTFLAGERPYDLILCRNLFIYLTPEARLKAMANVDRLLGLDARLCITPAEADRLPPGRFVLEGPTEFGIYRRVGVGSEIPTTLPPRRPRRAEPPPAPTTPPEAIALPTISPAADPLGTARLLADAGRLEEARAACEQLLQARPSDADALALLGVVHLAAGRADEAFDALRKALYLVPDHAEAMTHMVGLCERRGDKARASALRQRLTRMREEEA